MKALAVRFGLGISHAHEDEELAARVAGAAGPPLLAVEDDLIALHLAGGLHVGGVARGNGGLGHREAGPDLAVEQRLEPAFLLLRRPVAHQDLGVARIRGAAGFNACRDSRWVTGCL